MTHINKRHYFFAMQKSWEDKHFFSFILVEVFAVNNKINQLKIKVIKVYNSKQSMEVSKPKCTNGG